MLRSCLLILLLADYWCWQIVATSQDRLLGTLQHKILQSSNNRPVKTTSPPNRGNIKGLLQRLDDDEQTETTTVRPTPVADGEGAESYNTKINPLPSLRTAGSPLSTNKQPASLLTSSNNNEDDEEQVQVVPTPSTKLTHFEWESLLVKKLFSKRHYNPQVRPAISDEIPVEVSIELVLLQINEMVEKDQEIVISGFLKIKWQDARLTWDSSEYGGIDWIVTESTNCWLPDLALINSNDVYAVTRDMRFPLTLNASGDILFVPAGKIYARCELNLRYFPFDFQLCKYRFESWTYAAELVRISGLNFTIEPEHYMQNPEWEIPNAFVKTEIVHYESYNFSRVEFFMLLKRKSLFFITYTIFPCLALSVLQLMSHMLPFTEPERINFATTTLVAFSVFHVSIVEQMPHSSDSIPLLAIFVDSLMILIGLSLLECFIMMNWLSKSGLTVPSPRMWYRIVDRWGDYFLLGATSNYWRHNYLYVYERLTHKLDLERRRRQLERQRWASAEYQYRLKQTAQRLEGKDANFEALLYLVRRGERRRGGAISSADLVPPPLSPGFDGQQSATSDKYPNNTTTAFTFCETIVNTNADTSKLETSLYEQRPLLANRPVTLAQNNIRHSLLPKENNNAFASSSDSLHDAIANNRAQSPRQYHGNNFAIALSPSSDSINKTPSYYRRHQLAHHQQIRANNVVNSSSKEYLAPVRSSKTQIRRRHRANRHSVKAIETSLTCDFPLASKPPTVPCMATPEEGLLVSSSETPFNNNNDELCSPVAAGRQQQYRSQQIVNNSPSLQTRYVIGNNGRNVTSSPQLTSPTPSQQTFSPPFKQTIAGVQVPLNSPTVNGDNKSNEKKEHCCQIDELRGFVEEISNHITNYDLKKECTAIWTTYITVIDRLLSLCLCLLSFSLLFYLFFCFPEPPNMSKLSLGEITLK